MGKLYLDILDKKRKDVFGRLFDIFGASYYLAGGTALALQIKHRASEDFDLFSDQPVTLQKKQKLFKGLSKHKITTLVDTSDELTVVVGGGIKITLLNYFWKPLFPLLRKEGTVPLLSIKDIAATKAYALGRRGNFRDYIDLYFIIKDKYCPLKEVVRVCKNKYKELFSEKMFLEQLTYLDDIKEEKLVYFDKRPPLKEEVERYFRGQMKKI